MERVVPWRVGALRRRLNALVPRLRDGFAAGISAPLATVAIVFGAFADQPPYKATASREATAAQGRSRSTLAATCRRQVHLVCRGSPESVRAAMFKILQATSLRLASAWQARLPLQTNRPYLFRWFAQNDDLAHQIAQTRFGVR